MHKNVKIFSFSCENWNFSPEYLEKKPVLRFFVEEWCTAGGPKAFGNKVPIKNRYCLVCLQPKLARHYGPICLRNCSTFKAVKILQAKETLNLKKEHKTFILDLDNELLNITV